MMKRWLCLPAMAPVMWVLWRLVVSADRLHGWHYSENIPPPTAADQAYAAFAFSAALLTPVLVGLAAGIAAFRREIPPRWPVIEAVLVAFPYLTLGAGLLNETLIVTASLLTGGAIVMTLLNLGACASYGAWRKGALSAIVFLGGTLYLLWLYAFVIYIDT